MIKANYRQDYPPGSRTLGDFLFGVSKSSSSFADHFSVYLFNKLVALHLENVVLTHLRKKVIPIHLFIDSTKSKTTNTNTMETTSVQQPKTFSGKGALWTGRIITAITVLFLLMDAIMKVVESGPSMEGSVQLGWPEQAVQ